MKLKQTTIARPRIELFAAIASVGIICLNPATAASTIVSESFGGLGTDPLNGTTADTFSSAITTAGGSSTWSATTPGWQADGAVGGNNGSAFLNLGTLASS